MNPKQAIEMYEMSRRFILAIVNDFEEKDADFAPQEGMMTVVQQIRHTAITVDWFWDGAFTDKGFNMDFDASHAEVKKPSTVAQAVQALKDSYQKCIDALDKLSEDDLKAPLPPNEIFGQAPRETIFGPTADHSAHHRGAMAVYLRLCGKTPKMIYAPEG
jgi:uncharacterized damage-inducible protein DinB